ncbi:MAG: glycosyltransferase family 39 protein [Bacteroidales bacterium]|nr:glycosyltransferase family 39 protein [Bacteroidales bacterium]
MKQFLKTQKGSDILFIALLVVIGFSYNYQKLITENMMGAHIWRQADCLSLTLNYYQNGMRFFEPEIHNQLADNGMSGKSAGEFPILYYLNALIWQLTGPTPFTYRLLSLLLTFTGLFTFYRLLLKVFESKWPAFVLPLLLFTSPVYAIYGISFLTDVPAFSLSLMAWYFISTYFEQKKTKFLLIAMLLFALAGLLKVAALIGFVFLAIVLLIERLGFPTWKGRFLFRKTKTEWLAFAIVPALIFAWYFYADWYNNLHQGKYTFNNIWLFSDLKPEEQKDYLGNLRDQMLYVFYSKTVLFMLLFVWISNFFLFRRIPRFAVLMAVIIPVGVVIYALLWSGAFRNHDYYFVPLLHLVPAILIPFLLSFKNVEKTIFKELPLRVLTVVFLSYNVFYCGSFVFMRHFGNRGEFIMAGPSESVFVNKFLVKDYQIQWKPFDNIENFLIENGVEPEHKVICPSDVTINGSLFLMNRIGWTGYQQWADETHIWKKIQLGASFLVIHEHQFEELKVFHPFCAYPKGKHNNLLLFDLQPYTKASANQSQFQPQV